LDQVAHGLDVLLHIRGHIMVGYVIRTHAGIIGCSYAVQHGGHVLRQFSYQHVSFFGVVIIGLHHDVIGHPQINLVIII